MVIGWVQRQQEGATPWARVQAAQRAQQLPCLLVPQPAHAVLTGELAAALLPAAFGELPPEIIRAIKMHDTGWAASDAQQIQRLRAPGSQTVKAISFVAVSPAEASEAWTASIESVEAFSSLGALVVSRHFTLLAGHDPAHRQFKQTETARQGRLSSATLTSGQRAQEGDLDRWTAALGLCDLLSLYLLSGLTADADFPLAHPASPEAAAVARVHLQIEHRQLRFTPKTVRTGCALNIHALKHPLPAEGARVEILNWEVQ